MLIEFLAVLPLWFAPAEREPNHLLPPRPPVTPLYGEVAYVTDTALALPPLGQDDIVSLRVAYDPSFAPAAAFRLSLAHEGDAKLVGATLPLKSFELIPMVAERLDASA